MIAITEQFVKSLKKPEAGYVIHSDNKIRGFGLRITANGIVSFILNYTVHGRERRCTVGGWPELSVEIARQKALDLRRGLGNGIDPLAEKEANRTAPTVADLAAEYMTNYAEAKKRSHGKDRQMLDKYVLPVIGKHQARAITRRDIEALHCSMKSTPFQANRVLTLLSKMFNLGIEWKMAESNPATGIQHYHEEPRDTWLRLPQLRRLEDALSNMEDQVIADAIRLLIVTGSRVNEVLTAEWNQFDLDRAEWTKPSHHTKQQKTEHVPLSCAALSILTRLHERTGSGQYLIPGATGHRVDLRGPWARICQEAGLGENVHVHDLRHTFASILVSSGQPLSSVGKLLGHTQSKTTERYAHLSNDALKSATEAFGNTFNALRSCELIFSQEDEQ
jgi:integrase